MSQPSTPGPDAAVLRRALGPVAWCALECLTETAHGDISALTVRALARELGVAKNTAWRALGVLTRAGLVEAVQTRCADGRFEAGGYRLLADLATNAPATTSADPRTRRSARRPVADGQLSLLED